MIQQQLMHGEVKKLPEGHFRSVFTGRNFGVPGYMLCYSNPPVWTFDQALAQSIIFGIMPKANDAGEPLELMSEFWKFTDNFPIEDAVWKPYFENDAISTNENIKVSYFQYKNKKLVFVANTVIEPMSGEISLNEKFNVLSGLNIEIKQNCDKVKLNLKGYGFAIFEVDIIKI